MLIFYFVGVLCVAVPAPKAGTHDAGLFRFADGTAQLGSGVGGELYSGHDYLLALS
jgi:hypothetical protein